MKEFGSVLIIIGLIWGVFAFNIDTSVEVGGQSYGSGDFSITVPKSRINNFGLMNEKQNHIIGAGITLIIGVILFVFGARKEERLTEENNKQKVIQENDDSYKITFPMKNQNSWNNIKEKLMEFYKEYDIDNIISDKDSSWMIGGKEDKKGYVHVLLKDDTITIESFKVQKPDISIVNSEILLQDEKKTNTNTTDELIELGKLHENGLLTKEEFEKEKKKIFAS